MTAVTVRNAFARLPGTASSGRAVLVTAHYDSRAISPGAADDGLRMVRHVLDNHANLEGRPGFQEGDFWEFVDDEGEPLLDEGCILSDPGHALEFVGLAFKLLGEAGSRAEDAGPTADLFRVMDQVFGYGFQPGPGGICKAYDLVARRPIHTDMPWWSLPETIRTAALGWRALDDAGAKRRCLRIWAACHNAFFEHFLRPEVHLMAVQMRAADGSVSPAIPGTADADPGYHTGLSLLDAVEAVRTAP